MIRIDALIDWGMGSSYPSDQAAFLLGMKRLNADAEKVKKVEGRQCEFGI